MISEHYIDASLKTIFVAKEMVLANYINCYGLARLSIVTRKWSCQTIILIMHQQNLSFLWQTVQNCIDAIEP